MNKHLRAITGLDLRIGDDRIQLMQSMGDAAGFSASMRVLAIDLSKIASDLRTHGHGSAHRHRRDQAARRAARLVDHARQDQPVDPRDGESGLLPGHGPGHDRRHRRRARAARAQRDDAGHRVQRAALDAHPDERGDASSPRSAWPASRRTRTCARTGWSAPRRWPPRSCRTSATRRRRSSASSR